jgi:hypothetical protein
MNAPLHHDRHSPPWLVSRARRNEEVAVCGHDAGIQARLCCTAACPHARTIGLHLDRTVGGLSEGGFDILRRRIERYPNLDRALRSLIGRRPPSSAAPTGPYRLSASRMCDARTLDEADRLCRGKDIRDHAELGASGDFLACVGNADTQENGRGPNENTGRRQPTDDASNRTAASHLDFKTASAASFFRSGPATRPRVSHHGRGGGVPSSRLSTTRARACARESSSGLPEGCVAATRLRRRIAFEGVGVPSTPSYYARARVRGRERPRSRRTGGG